MKAVLSTVAILALLLAVSGWLPSLASFFLAMLFCVIIVATPIWWDRRPSKLPCVCGCGRMLPRDAEWDGFHGPEWPGKAKEADDYPYITHKDVLTHLSPEVRAALTQTPVQLVQQAWDGEIIAQELREALPPRRPVDNRVFRRSDDGSITVIGSDSFHSGGII